MLVLNHIGPPAPNALARIAFIRGVAELRPHGVTLGYEGMLMTLPEGSKTIEIAPIE